MEDGIGGYSIEVKQVEAVDEGEWKCVATSEENMKQITSCYVAMSSEYCDQENGEIRSRTNNTAVTAYQRLLHLSASPKELQEAALHGESEGCPDGRRPGLVRVQSRGFPDAVAEVVQGRSRT